MNQRNLFTRIGKYAALLALIFFFFLTTPIKVSAQVCNNESTQFPLDPSCRNLTVGSSCVPNPTFAPEMNLPQYYDSTFGCEQIANSYPDPNSVSCICGVQATYLPSTSTTADAPPISNNCNPGAESINLLDCFSLNSTQTVSQVYTSPAVLINLLVNLLFIIGGMVLFFVILYAGFLFITGDVKGKDKAQEIVSSAVLGFIVMFSAYWILQIIQTVTGANLM